MGISGVSGYNAPQRFGIEQSGNTDNAALQAKLEQAKLDVKNLKRSLGNPGSNVKQLKAEIVKREQEIRDLEKQVQQPNSSQSAVSTKQSGQAAKEDSKEQNRPENNSSLNKENLNVISGNTIDEYV